MIHSILPVQFMCLTFFLHHLSKGPVWSTSRSGTLHFILHTFLYLVTDSFHNMCGAHTVMDNAVGCYAYGNMFCWVYFKLYLGSSDDVSD